MKLNFAKLALVLFLLTAPLAAREKDDTLIMKNGDRLTCEVKGLSGGVLYVSFDYILSTQSVQWSKVAKLESQHLYIVKTEGGLVYTGRLSTVATAADRPVEIKVIQAPTEEVTLSTRKIVDMSSTSDNFWRRFNGEIGFGLNYSKGNNSTQFNFNSQTEYLRERWSAQANFASSLASSTGSSRSTRNQLTLTGEHLLPWNNYFYQGFSSFLQSTEQQINLQSSLGAGVGRYFKNTNRMRVALLGGFAWQNTRYEAGVPSPTQNVLGALVYGELQMFRFNKTNLALTGSVIPALSEPGRVHSNLNASYYLKFWSNLTWNFSLYGNWDNQPPFGVPGSDYGTSVGLSWTYGLR
jgi:hypothetical protein